MPNNGIRLDRSDLTIVVICNHDGCTWRAVRCKLSAAWTAGAEHLRGVHDDLHAGRRAVKAAREAARRDHLREDS